MCRLVREPQSMDFIFGSGPSGSSGNDRSGSDFNAFMDHYLKRVGELPSLERDEYLVTLIARSPGSPVAQAVISRAEAIQEASIELRVIFARLSPQQAMKQWFEAFSQYTTWRGRDDLRLVKNPNLLDAHEQLTVGKSMCWSGDSLRRAWDRHHHISLFEVECPGAARLSRLAFQALWSASVEVPVKYIERLHGVPADIHSGNEVMKVAEGPRPHKHQHWISTRH